MARDPQRRMPDQENDPAHDLLQRMLVWLSPVVTISGLVVLVARYFSSGVDAFRNDVGLAVVGIALLISLVATVFGTVRRAPATLTVALLGFPGTGKTVFLTILFDQLQMRRKGRIRFAPYGTETVEHVLSNLTLLRRGLWLPRTVVSQVFFFRAKATVQRPLFPESYKLEIADYAGEHLDELEPSSDRWLHRSDYFQYVVESDAVWLALDCEILARGDKGLIAQMEDAFVAAVQILAEAKGATESRKLRTPVALLFLKSDILEQRGIEHSAVLDRVRRLMFVCEARSRNFSYFFVSSTGSLTSDKTPPSELSPESVVEPLDWVLLTRAGLKPSNGNSLSAQHRWVNHDQH